MNTVNTMNTVNGLAVVVVITSLINVVLFSFGPAFIGYGITLLICGRSDPTIPTCVHCGAALSRAVVAAHTSCIACGTSSVTAAPQRSTARLRAALFILLPIVAWLVTAGISVAGFAFFGD